MLSLEDSLILYPNQAWLELSPIDQDIAWQQVRSQDYSHAAARDRAFYNILCLNKLIPWFSAEFDLVDAPTPWLSWADLPTVWEFVNGSILEFANLRIAIVPTDTSEPLCVEREWVDIPGWIAHYYVGVQIDAAAGWLRLLGYASHRQLKQQSYDPLDQTYSPPRLMQNLQTLWLTQSLCPPQLAAVPQAQPATLIDSLSQCLHYSPRLELPFVQWAAVIASDDTRRSLYQRRTASVPIPTKVRLSQWSHYVFEAGWQAVTDVLHTPVYAVARGTAQRAKLITLNNHAIALIVSREAAASEIGILLEARAVGQPLPPDLVLSVSFQDQFVQGNALEQSISARDRDVAIQLPRLLGTPGEEFRVTLRLGATSVTEEFVI
jgi:hypothetical protein